MELFELEVEADEVLVFELAVVARDVECLLDAALMVLTPSVAIARAVRTLIAAR